MKIIYQSPLERKEVISGRILSVIPTRAVLHIQLEQYEDGYEFLYNDSLVNPETRKLPCDGKAELIVVQGGQRHDYTVRPAYQLLSRKYAKAYEQFSYDYSRLHSDTVTGIRGGLIKLYAIEQTTEVHDWTDAFSQIEGTYLALKYICDRPKSHLRSANEVRPIETVKRVGYESIPYLAAHSEDWLSRTANGLKPARLFSRIEEDDYQIYENRVVKTLVDDVIGFLGKVEKELQDQGEQIEGILDSSVKVGSFGFDASFQKAVTEFMSADNLDDGYRIKAHELVEDMLSTTRSLLKRYKMLRQTRMYRLLRRTRPVPNPLKETNILLMDKHYSKAFKLWKYLRKSLAANAEDADPEDDYAQVCADYQRYCATLCEYTAHVLGFELSGPSCYERLSDHVGLRITCTDEGWVRIDVFDSESRSMPVAADIDIPIQTNETFSRFHYDGVRLCWPNDISQHEIEAFCSLFKTRGSRGKVQAEEKRRYMLLKQAIQAFEQSASKPLTSKILIVPMAVELATDTRVQFQEEMERASHSIRKTSDADIVVVALPTCNDNEQDVTCYALCEDQRHCMFPLSMYDINSYRRIQNLIYRQILALGKRHCPNCGRIMTGNANRRRCIACNGLTLTYTKCPQPDCAHQYYYLSFEARDDVIRKMGRIKRENFFHWDSLYQYKNIVPMEISEGRIRTICPRCHR